MSNIVSTIHKKEEKYMAKEEPIVFTRRASGLVREIGLFTAIAIPLTHTIGGGINKLLILASYEHPGANVPLAFILAGIPVMATAVSYTMLAVSMPRTGGDYIYISRGLSPVLGFLTSWGFWWTEIMSLGIIAIYDVDFWGLSFRIAGQATNSATWMHYADVFKGEGATTGLIIGFAIVIVSGLVTYFGARVYSWIINIGLILGIIGSVVMVIFFIYRSPGQASTLWNETYGAGTYEKIVQMAKDTGWTPTGFSFGATAGASIGAVWAYIGFTAGAYMGGEIKNPSKGMVWSITVSAVLIILYYTFVGVMVYRAFGDFIPMYTHVTKNASDQLEAIMASYPTPLLPTFAAALAPGQHILQFLMAASGAIWLLNDIPAFFLVCSRLVFSWSFDRFFPEKIAEVNDRWHSPHYAILLTTIGGLLGVAFYYGRSWVAAVDTTMLYIFAVMFGCLAAAVTPYVRREVYDRSIKWEILGLPLMTLAGIIGFCGNFILVFVAGKGIPERDLLFLGIWMTAGLIIFLAYYAHNIRKGVDVKTIYAEIPPA
jgi:APA family basic amino acid/polyamine antiporter